MNGTWFWLARFSQRLIVRASLYALFAAAAALAAVWLAPFVPRSVADRLGGEAIEGILTALASSLLAVTTFAASAVVVAYTAASAQLTPRAATFITSDPKNQNALATFVGAFLFAIVALVALGANYYGPAGRTILFLATLAMVGIVAVTLVGWIDRTARIANHTHVLSQIESAAREALKARMKRPFLGGQELKSPSTSGTVLSARRTGYIANIDAARIQKTAEEIGCVIEVLSLPGDFVCAGDALLQLPECATISEECRSALLDAIAQTDTRTVEQDPLYCLQILVEAAARALSPGVNDPGTAVLAIDNCYRVLSDWRCDASAPGSGPEYPRIKARELDGCVLVASSLGEIARFGAADVMVATRLQDAFSALAAKSIDRSFAQCATTQAQLALKRSEAAMTFAADRDAVRAAFRRRAK